MTVDDVIAYFETGYKMHKATGMSASNIKNWLKYGYIPIQTQMKIQQITNGDLKADPKDVMKEINQEKPYEFSNDNYATLYKKQKGVCAICKRSEKMNHYCSGKKLSLAFDHNHLTQKPRGLLCGDCNKMLGFARDSTRSLRNAITYLNRYDKEKKVSERDAK